MWDTAGQERFRSVTRSYYRGSAGALLVFDVTRRETFLHLTNWLTDCRNQTTPNTVILCIGNKCDLTNDSSSSSSSSSSNAETSSSTTVSNSNITLTTATTTTTTGGGVQRQVSFEEAQAFAQENNIMYMETSAKNGTNVEAAFIETAKQIFKKIEQGKIDANTMDSGVSFPVSTIMSSSSSASSSMSSSNNLSNGGGDSCSSC